MRMKAAVLYEQGKEHPFVNSNPLVVEDVDLEPPGDDEVLIKTGAAGLCHSDLSMIRGVMERKVPMVPGHEAAGIVEDHCRCWAWRRRPLCITWCLGRWGWKNYCD